MTAYENIQNGFNRKLYLQQNLDVANDGLDPLSHFLEYGRHEKCDPNDWFDTEFYFT